MKHVAYPPIPHGHYRGEGVSELNKLRTKIRAPVSLTRTT